MTVILKMFFNVSQTVAAIFLCLFTGKITEVPETKVLWSFFQLSWRNQKRKVQSDESTPTTGKPSVIQLVAPPGVTHQTGAPKPCPQQDFKYSDPAHLLPHNCPTLDWGWHKHLPETEYSFSWVLHVLVLHSCCSPDMEKVENLPRSCFVKLAHFRKNIQVFWAYRN